VPEAEPPSPEVRRSSFGACFFCLTTFVPSLWSTFDGTRMYFPQNDSGRTLCFAKAEGMEKGEPVRGSIFPSPALLYQPPVRISILEDGVSCLGVLVLPMKN
jgi:hypothetical protein